MIADKHKRVYLFKLIANQLAIFVMLSLFATNRAKLIDKFNSFDDDLYYEIGFEPRPHYLPKNAVVLTFDDGPDHDYTKSILNVLMRMEAKATFFLNTENRGSATYDPIMQELVVRMRAEGHELASHTVHHLHLAQLDSDEIEQQLIGVEKTMRKIFRNSSPRMTLFRAPFGEPYQDNDPMAPSDDYNLVAPIVARHAVHIGWQIDSYDYKCRTAKCVYNNVVRALLKPGKGDYGIILMHCIHKQTVEALPAIISYIRRNGFKLWTVEQVVRARYGKSSRDLIYGIPEKFNNLYNRTSNFLPFKKF